jgi:hypothetical protein
MASRHLQSAQDFRQEFSERNKPVGQAGSRLQRVMSKDPENRNMMISGKRREAGEWGHPAHLGSSWELSREFAREGVSTRSPVTSVASWITTAGRFLPIARFFLDRSDGISLNTITGIALTSAAKIRMAHDHLSDISPDLLMNNPSRGGFFLMCPPTFCQQLSAISFQLAGFSDFF